ncbi:hypothetical protein CAP35_03695 [Chitinophagaceae bacterium IBVUCB1]|nr:hypothetical protein CAP35_03695 [Chitinophagaceae bacterium IBVUCB1]
MSADKPHVLLVMHKVPVDSGFLAAKFIQLSAHLPVDLLVWDTKENVRKFIEKYALDKSYVKHIHIGYTKANAILNLAKWVVCLFKSGNLRAYIINGRGNIIDRIKQTFIYLPVIYLKPDIVHFEFGTIAKNGIEIKGFTDTKISVSFRGYDLNYADAQDKNYYSKVWNEADGFHFLGNDLKNRAIAKGYRQGKIEALIPPAIDTNIFKSNNVTKSYTKLQLISVGRLVWKKGFEYAIRAATILKQRGIDFEYKIIGDGNHHQALSFIIKESGLESQVKLVGEKTQTEIIQALNQSHIFIHPAISEGFSNAVIEAQSMGLPVVCTDADGLSENIKHNITGIIVPKWDEKAIADSVVMLWSDKKLLQSMAANGVARVQEHFTLDKQMSRFVSFYQQLYHASKD